MRLGINSWRSSLFTRFILVFLLIITPVYILGLSIYNWGLRMVEDEISLSMASQVGYFLNTLELEVKRLKALQYECLNDENLLLLANASQILGHFEKTRALLRLQHRLGVMKNSSIYIKDACAYIPSIQRTVSATSGVTENIEEIIEVSNVAPDESDSQIIYWKNRLFLCIRYPSSTVFLQRQPSFILLVELSNKSFSEGLLSFNSREGSGSLLVNRQKGYVLATGQENDVTEKVLKIGTQREKSAGSTVTIMKAGEKAYLVVIRKSDFLNIELATYTPEEQVYERIRKYQSLFIIFSAVSILIMVLFSLSTYRMVHKPLLKLVNSFKQLQGGVMDISIEYKHNDEFQYLYKSFNAMVAKLGELIDQVYKQKIFAQRAELKQLQSQINPHFLYNSFFIISRMARLGDCGSIKTFSQHLGSYYQFITRSSSDEVSLIRELEHARTYAEIQAMRFSNRVRVEFGELPEQYRDIQVPRLIIQPIIENAFEHGLKDKEENGLVRVDFCPFSEGLRILVEDNGISIEDEQLKNLNLLLQNEAEMVESTGIINVHRRIQLSFGKDSGLVVRRGSTGGTEVEIRIILQKGEDVV